MTNNCTLVSGFTKDDKFHPIRPYKRTGLRRGNNATVRYANDVGSSQLLEQSIRNFARKQKDRYNNFRIEQDRKFQEEINMRRRFSGKLITAFRMAQNQGITNPKQLEKFIRAQIPDLPNDKATNKFAEKVLREFVKQERDFKSKISGKSEAEKKLLQNAFDRSIEESESKFERIQKDLDRKFEEQEKQQQKEFEEKIKKNKEEQKKEDDAKRKAERDAREAEKKARSNASESEKKKAEEKSEQSEKQAVQQEKKQQDFEQEVLDELQKEQDKLDQSIEIGFPEGII